MKIINSVVLFVILVCGSQLSHGERLDCEFENKYYSYFGTLYSCVDKSLVNPNNNVTIEGYSGKHLANKNDADVKGIRIFNTNTKYIPTNLGSLFNLTVLSMENTQLVEINSKDFHGMQNLEHISLTDNKLSSVPLDAFATLTKLKRIFLNYNQIEELPNGIFKNNLELKEIYLFRNKIKYLGTEIFNDLKKLDYVELGNNICVNKLYNGKTEINKMKHDIKMNCRNPNEMQEKITKLEKELRESKEQQQTNEDALKKELREAKEHQQTNEDALKKELRESKEQQKKNEDALKKELREAKEQQQTNEDALKKELREAKEQQQTTEDALKKELRESKEQQKKNEDALKKELREAKEQQQTNEDALKKELREAKEDQQTNEDALKKELREAKEDQQTNEDALKKELREAKEQQQTNEAESLKEKYDCQKELIKKMNKLLNAMDVQLKDRVEIEKLRTALVEAKDREQVKVFEVSNLNQDLLECKQMNERIPKLERETYEQRRMERSALIEVKGKLKRAEEQLAQCLKDNPGM